MRNHRVPALSRAGIFTACLSLVLVAWAARPCLAYPPFTIESVDATGDVGLYTSIKVDASGNPHISYYDQDHGNLKYAHKSAGIWVVETVDASINDVGQFTSLALDKSGNPHISYYDTTNGNLLYAHKVGGIWVLETVDATAHDVGRGTSIALTSVGEPRIS